MSSEPVVVRITRVWVSLYTRGLPPEIGEQRVLQIESDMWEHMHDPGTADREILGRSLRGIHADVWWRYRTLLESRGARQRSQDMTKRNWWTPVTAVIGIVIATMGLLGVNAGETATGSGELVVAAALPAVGGMLMLTGLAVRRSRVLLGSWLVIGGAVLSAFDPILIPFAAFIVISGIWSGNLATSRGRVGAVNLEATKRSLTQRWYIWVGAGLALAALGTATLAIWENSGIVPQNCTETSPCWQDTAAWATWILSWLAAAVAGAIGVVLGVLHIFTRHHTRPV